MTNPNPPSDNTLVPTGSSVHMTSVAATRAGVTSR